MVVHAAPNTQPGGVHGAFERPKYHSDFTSLLVKNPPMASAAKLMSRNNMKGRMYDLNEGFAEAIRVLFEANIVFSFGF